MRLNVHLRLCTHVRTCVGACVCVHKSMAALTGVKLMTVKANQIHDILLFTPSVVLSKKVPWYMRPTNRAMKRYCTNSEPSMVGLRSQSRTRRRDRTQTCDKEVTTHDTCITA